jgi:hypothetical protein
MLKRGRFILFLLIASGLGALAQETETVFLPAWQGFNFYNGRIVDYGAGDIAVKPYEVTCDSGLLLIYIDKGFLDDFGKPADTDPRWRPYVEFVTGGVYCLQYKNGDYVMFELINIETSGDEVSGVEIDYKCYRSKSRK